MIHTIHIDDSTLRGKQIIKELKKEKKLVRFDNPAITGRVPDGYLSPDEFIKETNIVIQNQFKKHGLL